ncbi:hypothetical protein JRQ81_014563 [Phrynocephalus forsythii]|uniref:Olfactomedin-like domain-containing protein n=1 Tax=Phrynocephalus forsythii TaxID=171643 RepID=A0A9Q1B3U0_9SAUR|nr:hypothetical protein JRQ81_014563 [Phrynocephalus forsythii]
MARPVAVALLALLALLAAGLLGDYDKVKAVSEGSDCQCKCVVRPLGRDACQRVNKGTSRPEDFYVVETITSGPECRCACVAPPSALNPCEGDFRLKKLREADSKDFKLSAVIEMLEGAFYGLDLLKLHAVTTKLVGRVEKLEEEVSRNLTKDSKQKRQNAEESLQEMDDCSDACMFSLSCFLSFLKEKHKYIFLHDEQISSVESLHSAPPAQGATNPESSLPKKLHTRSRIPSQPTIIRGVTYYKATDPEMENDLEEQDEPFSGDAIDLLIEDQLLQHNYLSNTPTRKPSPVEGPHIHQRNEAMRGGATSTTPAEKEVSATTTIATEPPVPSAITPPSVEPKPSSTSSVFFTSGGNFSTFIETTGTAEAPPINGSKGEDNIWAIETLAETTTQVPRIQNASTTRTPTARVPSTTSRSEARTESTSDVTTKAATPPAPARASPTATSASLDEEDIRNSIGQCKDTLSTISGPVVQNTYGRNEGAWMKDPVAKDERIYITNYYYGNTLMEFRNLDSFKQGRWSNSYKLPYSWMGTGHVVFNGSLYYNRAFTRNLIKYDLKHRYVAAWAMLHDVAYEEETPWRWRGHSDMDFAVDENGLWIIYPAINYEGFSQEVIVLSRLNAMDLSTRKETTWRTGLRKNFYGNSFVICGVLYAVDSYNKKNANISYAFDTHTNTQIIPRLLFENEYSYTTQIDYNPKDRLLYAWDNGHQVTYNVIFAY